MTFRRSAAVAAVLSAVALVSGCKEVSQEAPPSEFVVAAFNAPIKPGPVSLSNPALVPTPNDLALQAAPTLAPQLAAQKALLQAFVAAGGFPSDQAVGITIPIKRLVWNGSTGAFDVATPPFVDPSTLTTTGASPNVVVLKIDVSPPAVVPVDPDPANCTTGQIALLRAKDPTRGNTRAFAPGRYAFAIRANAVRTTTGVGVGADQGIALVAPNKDLSNPNNQPPGGLPASLVPTLEVVRKSLWNPTEWNASGGLWAQAAPGAGLSAAFPAVSKYIAPEDVAVIATFEIAPAIPTAPVDSGSGIAPLPLDLLRVRAAGSPAIPNVAAACPGPESCVAPNAAFLSASYGLTTLDGFSTTAMVFAPTTVPVDASSVNGSTVYLFKLAGGTVTLLKELKQELQIFALSSGTLGDPLGAAYVAEPTAITTTQGKLVAPGVPCAAAGGCSLIVGLQPAVGAPVGPPFGTINLPPLDEATDYAVVVTTSVKDMLGRPLRKSTVGILLTDPNPAFDAMATSSVVGVGKSLLAGISDDTAAALLRSRTQLKPVLAVLPGGRTAADVALAYTFRTQGGMKSTALNLVMAQWAQTGATSGVVDASFLTTTQVVAQYGIGEGFLVSPSGLASIAEVTFPTRSLLLDSRNSGAFDPAHATTENITALVALPDPSLVTSICNDDHPGLGYASTTKCAPLVIYAHGLANSKADMLPVAAALASRGFVVAAIDAEKHGQRSYCSSDTATIPAALQCAPGSTCVYKPNLTTPVDVDANGAPIQIGVCELSSSPGVRGALVSYRADFRSVPACTVSSPPPPIGACLSAKGNPYLNANRLVTLNFFRVRDSMRQSIVDFSALAKALAPIGQSGDAFAANLAARGLAVDFSRVYFVGHSYGAISGAASLAVNPRLSRAVTYAAGATALDVFSNPQSGYSTVLNNLLAQGGILPGTPDYLKTLQLGKWILDPAEPANFLHYVLTSSLPNPYAAAGLQSVFPSQPKDVLGEISLGDGSVPNAQNTYFAGRLGYPVPDAGSAATDSFVQWYVNAASGADPVTAKVTHGNLLDFLLPAPSTPTLTQQAQSNAASFLANPVGQAATVRP